ncbi:MAG: flippase-like domain-containing protein [Deltaproteobacteria bacterium]|nr:flippase-like domain-containing protein [Deltaproteobacteria bacterium]MBW2101893.1 flippase-like domain-containing protein [Deltaproteobacteria bacterium]RLB40864.1 MAG: hypothetical protein DRH20_00295 [Deltaproteobacteria bacterium]
MKNWKAWLGILISAIFLYVAFRNIDGTRLWSALRSARMDYLAAAGFLSLLQYVIRTWRWGILLEPVERTSFGARLSANLIGFAANFVLPARLGELIRADTLARSAHISTGSTLGTLVVERLFDGFTLLLALLIGLLGTSFPPRWQSLEASLRMTGFVLLGAYLGLILFLSGFRSRTEFFLNLLEKVLFFLPLAFREKILRLTRNFSLGLVLPSKARGIGLAVFHSLLLWLAVLYQIRLVQASMDLSVPFVSAFIVLSMASFGVMIPSAPGFIGTFHLSVQYGLLFYGVGREEALSAAIAWHAAIFFPTVLAGLFTFLLAQAISHKRPLMDPSEERDTGPISADP